LIAWKENTSKIWIVLYWCFWWAFVFFIFSNAYFMYALKLLQLSIWLFLGQGRSGFFSWKQVKATLLVACI